MRTLAETLSSYDAPSTKKRTRVLLSCILCRASKLKCDRGQPCIQCTKKGRADSCIYAPKPERKSPVARGMAARLKRLECLVRDMMDENGNPASLGWALEANDAPHAPPLKGQVIQSERAMTYVGATHCLAMLEDIEDIKAYFDDPDQSDDDVSSKDSPPDARASIPFSRVGAPRSRDELLAMLPDKDASDKMIAQYFAAMTPTQYVIHRPTFLDTYEQFWHDHDSVSMHWVSVLFTTYVCGIYHNNFVAFLRERRYSSAPVKDLLKQYHSCAGWALVLGNYTHPTTDTITAFLLFAESDFLLNPSEKSTCYILSGVCMRLMLKMGYHRDPCNLADITPFEGEMRRRQWCMAIQLDGLINFQMGLPVLIVGLESDTEPPHNLEDTDFGPSCKELPASPPPTEYTYMSYTICKLRLVKVFAKIAQQAHSLISPMYSDVLALDNLHNQAWKAVPHFLQARPLEECFGEPPYQIVQRLCIACFHYKSICVLHRRYLVEPTPAPEHDYSRQQCLESAIALLNFQYSIWKGSKPGNNLGLSASFINSLAIHDFLLAVVILYVIIQSDNYADDGTGFGLSGESSSAPRKDELKAMIRWSYDINYEIGSDETDQKKTAYALRFMLEKLGCPVETAPSEHGGLTNEESIPSSGIQSFAKMELPSSPVGGAPSMAFSTDGHEASYGDSGLLPPPLPTCAMNLGMDLSMDMDIGMNMGPLAMGLDMGNANSLESNLDFTWSLLAENLEWSHLDASIAQYPGGSFFNAAYPQPGVETFVPENMGLVAQQLWSTDYSFNNNNSNSNSNSNNNNNMNNNMNNGRSTGAP